MKPTTAIVSIVAMLAIVVITLLFAGCTAPVPATTESARENPCGVDTGLEVDADGRVVTGIDQCAIRERFRAAYDARAAELGCDAPFPEDAFVDEGLEDCLVELVDEWARFEWASDCGTLYDYAADPETYHGFVCGDDCTTTGTGIAECCPGTPYELRAWDRCPYWCDGLSQCNADPACVSLLEERGPRR